MKHNLSLLMRMMLHRVMLTANQAKGPLSYPHWLHPNLARKSKYIQIQFYDNYMVKIVPEQCTFLSYHVHYGYGAVAGLVCRLPLHLRITRQNITIINFLSPYASLAYIRLSTDLLSCCSAVKASWNLLERMSWYDAISKSWPDAQFPSDCSNLEKLGVLAGCHGNVSLLAGVSWALLHVIYRGVEKIQRTVVERAMQ